MTSWGKGILGAVAAAAVTAFCASAEAAVVHPGTLPVGTVVTAGYIDIWFGSQAHLDVGVVAPPPALISTVETALESATWLNIPLTYVGSTQCTGATCPANINAGGGNNASLDLGIAAAANVWGIWYDNAFIALVYGSSISSFSISALPNKVAGVYAFCSLSSCTTPPSTTSPVPLPAAVWLLGTALVGGTGLGTLGRRRNRA